MRLQVIRLGICTAPVLAAIGIILAMWSSRPLDRLFFIALSISAIVAMRYMAMRERRLSGQPTE